MPHFIFIQQISILSILNMLYNLHFFSSKCRLFHNATLFAFCITHILNTGCVKIWKKKIRRQKVNAQAQEHMPIIRPAKEHSTTHKQYKYTITIIIITNCNNNLNRKHWAIVGTKLSELPGDPDSRGTTVSITGCSKI